MNKVWYRLTQFWLDLFPHALTPNEWEQIRNQLSHSEFGLFQNYSKSDQYHAYRVFQMLRTANYLFDDLLTAALLHDIGKSKYQISILDRVWPVVIKKIWPSKYHQWGADEDVRWKRPFIIKQQHAKWGADMVRAVGGSEEAIALIRRHQDPIEKIESEEDALLQKLQWADNQS